MHKKCAIIDDVISPKMASKTIFFKEYRHLGLVSTGHIKNGQTIVSFLSSFKINDIHMFSVIVDIQGRLFHIKVCKYICL